MNPAEQQSLQSRTNDAEISYSNRGGQGRIVVIGAGISGLMVAYLLKRQGRRVTVLEKEFHVGGTIRTFRDDGWLVEAGPNSTLETTPLFQQVFQELGIAEQVVYANKEASTRYILRSGKLHSLPLDPFTFIGSRLWSWKGKLRLLQEPFIGRADKEESIAEFVERRLGKEILDYAINPFVAGLFAGNPEQLSIQAAFPKLHALEQTYGGLVKGMIRGRKSTETTMPRAKLFSFAEGMQTFSDALAKKLGESLKLDCNVGRITRRRFPSPENDPQRKETFTIEYRQNGSIRSVEADILILAAPAYAAARMIESIDNTVASLLESIYYPPVAEVFMGFKQEQAERPLDGFGFLVPEKEQRSILGTIWSSAIFAHRAPEGYIALTTFVGGARQPELALRDDRELGDIVLAELRQPMRIKGSPQYTKITRWERAIPQYELGHLEKLKMLEEFESKFDGLHFCGNFRGGISVGDCMTNAQKLVDRVRIHYSSGD